MVLEFKIKYINYIQKNNNLIFNLNDQKTKIFLNLIIINNKIIKYLS